MRPLSGSMVRYQQVENVNSTLRLQMGSVLTAL